MIELENTSKRFLYKYDWFFNHKNFIMFYAKSLSDKAVIWNMERYCNFSQLSTIILDGKSKFWQRFPYAPFVASVASDIFVVGFDYLEQWEDWIAIFSFENSIGICFYQSFIYLHNLNLNYNFFDLYIYFWFVYNTIVRILFTFVNNLLLNLTNLW